MKIKYDIDDIIKQTYDSSKKYRFIVGIDPDVEASGYCMLDTATKTITELQTIKFPLLVNYIYYGHNGVDDLLYVVEAGWKNKTNWHLGKMFGSTRLAAAKGSDVGRNHEVGILLCEMLEYNKIPYVAQRPLKKCWKTKTGKISQKEFVNLLSGSNILLQDALAEKNQETRDAALLAINASSIPIKMIL